VNQQTNVCLTVRQTQLVLRCTTGDSERIELLSPTRSKASSHQRPHRDRFAVASVNITMQLGATTEVVTVQSREQLDRSTSNISTLISPQEVANLPLRAALLRIYWPSFPVWHMAAPVIPLPHRSSPSTAAARSTQRCC